MAMDDAVGSPQPGNSATGKACLLKADLSKDGFGCERRCGLAAGSAFAETVDLIAVPLVRQFGAL
jgi:hypothetical protein